MAKPGLQNVPLMYRFYLVCTVSVTQMKSITLRENSADRMLALRTFNL